MGQGVALLPWDRIKREIFINLVKCDMDDSHRFRVIYVSSRVVLNVED